MAFDATQNPNHARRWTILGILGVAQLMVVLDATIVNIALPSAEADLGFSTNDRQWVITAYALAFGSLLLLGGRIGDLFGRKRTFVVGLVGFSVASAIGGAAQSFGVLVAARALQGVFGALLAPSALGLLTTTFVDPKERAKAFGIFGAIAGGGGGIGLLLGGVLTEYASWRWCLYVNLLFALPAAVAAALVLKRRPRTGRAHLDIPGTLTASAGLFALVYGFAHAEQSGWTDTVTVGFLAAAVVLLAAFAVLQTRVAHPLLPMRIVTDRNRGGSYLGIGISAIGIFGVFLFLTFFLQETLGYSPIKTGLAFLPMNLAIIATATTAQTKLVPRIGARPLVTVGMLLAAAAMLVFTQLETSSTYVGAVLPGLLLVGVGLGCIFAPAIATATSGVDPSDAGVASAMVNTSQQVGGSVGTALLSTIFASAVTSYAAGRPQTAATLAEASVHGYTTAFRWAFGLFLVGAVVCGAVLRSGVAADPPHAVPEAAPAL
jgi:EmrB/QacA subfamily drug resistance transporter